MGLSFVSITNINIHFFKKNKKQQKKTIHFRGDHGKGESDKSRERRKRIRKAGWMREPLH